MAIIKCKMCGGDLRIEEGSTVCECEYCGTRQTVPSADNEKKLTLFSRAGRLLRGCEFDKAAGVFEAIVADFPEEAEAYWGLVLCKYGIEYVDDPATGKKIPTCHRSSFDSVLDDPNYEQACENTDAIARRVYRDEARQIEDLRKQIIEVSGKEDPYDIFISYKETDEHGDRTLDSVIAQDIYTELTEKGYRVFFSRISLEDKLGTEYEPYIFAALNSAKVMLVVGTDYENFDSVWVKNEWSRFLKLIVAGQKKTLIPVFKNMDAYDMPKEFAKLAAQDMGKVGAMQDLVRGVEKLINKKAAPVKETVKETVVVQQSSDGAARITAAMDRGFMALEDGEWDKAVSFFDQALSLDAKNARAYYGMALAKAQCRDADVYINMLCAGTPKAENIELPRDEKHIREVAEKYAVPGYLSAEEIRALYDYKSSYHSTLQSQKQLSAQAKKKYESDRNLTRARQFAAGEFKTELEDLRKKLLERLDKAVRDAEESSEKAKQQAEKTYKSFLTNKDRLAEEKCREAGAKREADYQDAMRRFEHAKSIENYQNTKPLFIGLVPYKDSAEMVKRCEDEAARIEREAAEVAERKRKAEAEEAERQRLDAELSAKKKRARTRRRFLVALFAVVIAVAGYYAYSNIVVPYKDYKVAEALFAEGRYNESLAIYKTLGSFMDSETKAEEVKTAVLERDYADAVAIFESGEYVKALDAFQVLGNYKDSKAKYEEAKAAAMEQNYIAAIDLFDSGEYEKAFAAFSSLGSYKDSPEKMEEAKTIFNSKWKNIISIAAGQQHTVGLRKDGTVVATGNNDHGECDVSEWRNIIAIAAGNYHTVGLRANGTVVAVGMNSKGQCNVTGWKDIVAVAAGYWCTIGLKKDGTVVAVGINDKGQCDVSGWKNIITIEAGGCTTIGLRSNGSVVTAGTEKDVSGWKNIVSVAEGEYHAVGLQQDGRVVATGINDKEGICDVSTWRDIVSIAAGDLHTVGLLSDGSVVATGHNSKGECDVDSWKEISAIAAGGHHTVGLKKDGTVIAAGSNGSGQCDFTG